MTMRHNEKMFFYSMTGCANAMVTVGNKKLFPLIHNSVRMIAGTEALL